MNCNLIHGTVKDFQEEVKYHFIHEHIQVSFDTSSISLQEEWRLFSKVLPQTCSNFTKLQKGSKVHLIQSDVSTVGGGVELCLGQHPLPTFLI